MYNSLKMDTFLKDYKLSNLNQNETDELNSPKTTKKINRINNLKSPEK